ncbi:uncharacterized protein LOC142590009 isoform X4 [Dermacentor variabilis]|uniref:uncharacterized protein LOC142590009 isoform X4 n=1 Tax=Dermacentor variabilis TaxID=34621 RepID=UPI003F5B41CC
MGRRRSALTPEEQAERRRQQRREYSQRQRDRAKAETLAENAPKDPEERRLSQMREYSRRRRAQLADNDRAQEATRERQAQASEAVSKRQKPFADVCCANEDLACLCTVDNKQPQVPIAAGQLSPEFGLINAVNLDGNITAITACPGPSEAIGQVEVGTQCSVPLVDKSVGCSFKASSESRSVQTIETVDQSSSSSGIYLTTGAFRTSPVLSHYVESNKLSLRLQRPYSSVTYYLKHPSLLFLHQQPMVTIHRRDPSAKIISVTMKLINCFVWKHMPGSVLASILLSAIYAL